MSTAQNNTVSTLVATLLVAAASTAVWAQPPDVPSPLVEQGAVAWYDVNTGRVWISANTVFDWSVQGLNQIFTGPDNPVLAGGIPAGGGLASFHTGLVGESALSNLSYGPLDLGRIATPGLSRDDFVVRWNASNFPGDGHLVVVPEPWSNGQTVFLTTAVFAAVTSPLRRRVNHV